MEFPANAKLRLIKRQIKQPTRSQQHQHTQQILDILRCIFVILLSQCRHDWQKIASLHLLKESVTWALKFHIACVSRTRNTNRAKTVQTSSKVKESVNQSVPATCRYALLRLFLSISQSCQLAVVLIDALLVINHFVKKGHFFRDWNKWFSIWDQSSSSERIHRQLHYSVS